MSALRRLGLPREIPPELERIYPAARVAEKRNATAFGVRDRHWILARIQPRLRETLRNTLKAI